MLDDVPPSVEALLASRLDLLAPDERGVLQRAAVVGATFSRRALAELSPPRQPTLSAALFELVRKGLVRPEPEREEASASTTCSSATSPTTGCRRQTARACTSASPTGWTASRTRRTSSSATTSSRRTATAPSSGPPNRRAKQLAADAGARLGAAGMRAFRTGDMPATTNLLGRAAGLLPDSDPRRRAHLVNLGLTLDARNESEQAVEALTQAVDESVVAKDRSTEVWARMEREFVELRRQPKRTADALLENSPGSDTDPRERG